MSHGAAAPPAEDACPEPNDTYQASCFIGAGSDALGSISHPTDTDAYRIEVLDLGVVARVELADVPARIVSKWRTGTATARSTSRAPSTRSPAPLHDHHEGRRDAGRAAALLGLVDPSLADMTVAVDARITNDVDGGHQVLFRFVDAANHYRATVRPRQQLVVLAKLVEGRYTELAVARSEAVAGPGSVNRTVVRCTADAIEVHVNGRAVLRASDGSLPEGGYGFGVIAYGNLPTINFDNLLVTSPT